jgi:hypothetical protein
MCVRKLRHWLRVNQTGHAPERHTVIVLALGLVDRDEATEIAENYFVTPGMFSG